MTFRHTWGVVTVSLLVTTLGGCATRSASPAAPASPKYTEFVFPAVPPRGAPVGAAAQIERGWRLLQQDDRKAANHEFSAILERTPTFHPALTAAGYVRLADRDYRDALKQFDSALQESSMYASALVGRGHALLALDRAADALASFEAALTADKSLTDLRPRVDVLRFRAVQDTIERARAAAKSGRLDDARTAFQRALAASPDSAFLHRELGAVERRRGDAPAAVHHLRRATELDPTDADAFAQLGVLFEEQKDYVSAEAAYRKAADLNPSPDLTRRLSAVGEQIRLAKLPDEYRALPDTPQITRGDLAALIGIRLDALLEAAPRKQVVMTDIRTHWANAWIARVAQAGIIEPFANHAFQPRTQLRRVDLAMAVSRLLTIAGAARPEVRARWAKATPKIADVGAGHLSYSAVSVAVASEVMPLLEGARFQMARPVSGAEAIETIDRVRALAVVR